MIIKPSRFSAQAVKSISGVTPSVQQSTIMVHSTTDHDVDDGNLIIKPSRFSAQAVKSISEVTPSVQQSTIMVHSTTDNYVDDETVDEDLRCLASAIQRRESSSTSNNESEKIVQSSTTTIPHAVDADKVDVQLKFMGSGSTQSSGIQGSSQHHTSGLLQLASDISKEADV